MLLLTTTATIAEASNGRFRAGSGHIVTETVTTVAIRPKSFGGREYDSTLIVKYYHDGWAIEEKNYRHCGGDYADCRRRHSLNVPAVLAAT